MRTRRQVLRGVGTIGAASLAGCTGLVGSDSEDPVRFGLVPVQANVDVTEQWGALFEHIEEETGATVEPNKVADYSSLIQAVRNDQVDVAGSPHSIAVIGDSMGETDVVGQRLIVGTKWEFSLITTWPEDNISSPDDLEGTTVSLADPLSTPGSLFPLHMMMEAGVDIGDAPTGGAAGLDVTYTDHTTARKNLIERTDVKAAGTGGFSTLSHVPKSQLPDRVKNIALGAEGAGSSDPQLDLLAASEKIPRPPIIARRNWDADVRSDVETAMLDAPEEAFKDEDVETQLWFDGVSEADIGVYDPVKTVINDLGIELEDYGSSTPTDQS